MKEMKLTKKDYQNAFKVWPESDNVYAAINDIGKKQLTSYYYSTDTVYGILSELGGTNLSTTKKHIYLDGFAYRIYISKGQDLELKPYYGIDKLRVELRQKRSAIDGHIVNSELLSFIKVGKGNLIDNINNSDDLDLPILRGVHTLEDILNNNGK